MALSRTSPAVRLSRGGALRGEITEETGRHTRKRLGFTHVKPVDDELVVNPPTPCQIGKHPPAPKKTTGQQGAHGGRYFLTSK